MRSTFLYGRLIEKIDAALDYLSEHKKLNSRHRDALLEILEPIAETLQGGVSTNTEFREVTVVRELKYKHGGEWGAYRAYFLKFTEKVRDNKALCAEDEAILREIAEIFDDIAIEIIDGVVTPTTIRVK